MKALFSFWGEPLKVDQAWGWGSFAATCLGWTLSSLYAARAFGSVSLFADAESCRLFADEMKLPFSEVDSGMDRACKNVPPKLWSYGKLAAMQAQKEPFAHLDHDLFLTQPLNLSAYEGCAAVFERAEPIEAHFYGAMVEYVQQDARERGSNPPSWLFADPPHAVNAGIVVGLDLDFVQHWCHAGRAWVTDPRSRGFWQRALRIEHHTWCVMFEQFSAACIAKQRSQKLGVLLQPGEVSMDVPRLGYHHFISALKREKLWQDKARVLLERDFPGEAEHLDRFIQDNQHRYGNPTT